MRGGRERRRRFPTEIFPAQGVSWKRLDQAIAGTRAAVNKQIPSYLKLVTDTISETPAVSQREAAALESLCHAFEQATQWRLELADGGCVMLDCAKSAVTIDPELRRRVEELLGPGSFRVTGAPPKASTPQNGANGRRRQMARS